MANIFPRYANNTVKQYTTLENIQEFHPALLDPQSELNQQQNSGMPQNPMVSDLSIESQIKSYEENKGQLMPYSTDNTAVDIHRELEALQPTVRKLDSPNMVLQGHGSEVFCCKFSTDGNFLATAGHDKQVLIWDIWNKCTNTLALRGHKNAILDLRWSYDGTKIYTASADKTVSAWDIETGKRLKRFKGHSSFVNCCDTVRRGLDYVISGSDDNTVRLWDLRDKNFVSELAAKYPVLSLAFNDSADKVYTGGKIICFLQT
jgi:Prp8 binding protein